MSSRQSITDYTHIIIIIFAIHVMLKYENVIIYGKARKKNINAYTALRGKAYLKGKTRRGRGFESFRPRYFNAFLYPPLISLQEKIAPKSRIT